MTKKASASWAVLQQAVREYREAGEVHFTVHGQHYALWVGMPKSPERRKRNSTLRRLLDFAKSKGANNLDIDWWNGSITTGGKRLATVRDSLDYDIDFVKNNPCLDPLEATQWLKEKDRIFRTSSDWQAPL